MADQFCIWEDNQAQERNYKLSNDMNVLSLLMRADKKVSILPDTMSESYNSTAVKQFSVGHKMLHVD